jgi:hypothetical protein
VKRDDLTATNWFSSRFVFVLLIVAAVFFAAEPDWMGYSALARMLGGKEHLLAIGLGVAFVVVAAQSWEKAQMRVQMAETMEALHQLLYGRDYRRDREAIEILLTALESQTGENAKVAHGHLMRLTGQNFAQDPKVWRSWWEANKKKFERIRDAAPPETK